MFTYWIFYVMAVVLVVTGVLQVRYLQKALQIHDSTVCPSLLSSPNPRQHLIYLYSSSLFHDQQEVIPTQFVMFTIFAILGGGILYDDFSKLPGLNVSAR